MAEGLGMGEIGCLHPKHFLLK